MARCKMYPPKNDNIVWKVTEFLQLVKGNFQVWQPLSDLEGRVRSNLTTSEDSQSMITYRLA